jgi:hypothetical protein
MASNKDVASTSRASGAEYVLSFQAEPFHQHTRYYWTICTAQNPEKLVSWGHAPTQEQAETAARKEAGDLAAGLSKGGRVTSTVKPFTFRR